MRVHRFASALALLFAVLLPAVASAAPTVRVPGDARDLQRAIGLVADGGVIELAGGTYAPPPRGFEIANLRKGFTIRAAAGATVVLDGAGTSQLLRFENGRRERGKLVTFEGITFRSGYTVAEGYSGGVTLSAAEARFVRCVFQGNHASGRTTGGGAVRVMNGSEATFESCSFRDNSSLRRGGAMSILASSVSIQGGELVGNRVNLPGHDAHSAGGGIYLLNSTLQVTGVRFQGNEAGFAGGAIYAYGAWTEPEATPRSRVLLTRSTFDRNRAASDPCCPAPGPTTGGAIHGEDQTTVEIYSSYFTGNSAEFGGAIDSYRGITVIQGSQFQGNQAPLSARTGTAAGGAIFVSSPDFADASTGAGVVNRRPASLSVSDSLLRGGGSAAAHVGGCLMVSGDESRAYGLNGVAAAGDLTSNRARVSLRKVVFANCDVQKTAQGGAGMGGAVHADLVDLTMEDSLVLDSGAASGGGMTLLRDSVAAVSRVTFARNKAERLGGAMFVQGSQVQVAGSSFFSNEVGDGRGAAIYSIPLTSSDPSRVRNVGGVVADSVFSANVGLAIWDVDPQSGPINEMRYDRNRFYLPSGEAYGNSLVDANGVSPSALNNLVVDRGGRGVTVKSAGGNERLSSAPRAGALLAAPSARGIGAPSAPAESFLAYAWSGRSANLAGQGLSARAGLLPVAAAGDYALSVDGGAVASARLGASSCTAGATLCLNGDRFRAEVTWRDFQGNTGAGKAVSLTGDTGYFWFFQESNVELVVKVLDGREVNGRYWVFYGALSNVEYTLRVTDTATGRVQTYRNPSGSLASVGDTNAFPAGAAASAAFLEEGTVLQEPAVSSTCAPGPADLCLGSGRFRISLRWKDFQGRTGVGQAVPLTGDTGYFWFFGPSNVEVVVKVLDGRPVNGHFWVFYGALTNVEYTLEVTDTQTGETKTYRNPLGRFGSAGDVEAL